VVVSKLPGMLVHRGMGASRDETFLLQAVRDLVGCRVHAIHRLDRPTSGAVLFALDPETARTLTDSWQRGEVRKSYLAIARGWMPESEGLRDEALDDPDNGVLREASTRWKEIARTAVPGSVGPHAEARFCLLEVEPLTGRWHQIRRHFSRMAHPLAGDTTHGDRHTNHFLRDRYGWWQLLLWAKTLEFPHPEDGRTIRVEDREENGILGKWKALTG
jgi:tRNA pseudouridine65 synthase